MTPSDSSVTSHSRHTVEISVLAGKLDETLIVHYGDDQGISVEKARLAGEVRRPGNVGSGDSKSSHTGDGDLIEGLPGPYELLDFRGMPAQAIGDPLDGPTKPVGGLDGHDAVNDLSKNVRRGDGNNLLILDPIQEDVAGNSRCGMSSESKDEDVGVYKHCCASNDVGQRHGASRGSFSSERIK